MLVDCVETKLPDPIKAAQVPHVQHDRAIGLDGCHRPGRPSTEWTKPPPLGGPFASGAGHDAQDFAHAGFPAGMIFVRNANGSHNPFEAMRMDDFCQGTQLLAWMLVR